MSQYIASMESDIDFITNVYLEDTLNPAYQFYKDNLRLQQRDEFILQKDRVFRSRSTKQSFLVSSKSKEFKFGATIIYF